MYILASFPGRSHLQYTVSNQILEVGTAWEQPGNKGYVRPATTINPASKASVWLHPFPEVGVAK